jgi:hypothetical protein
VILTTSENPVGFGAWSWCFAVGVEGPLRITDITLEGTVSCESGLEPFAECRRWGNGFGLASLTGPPNGLGPQTEENVGAVSSVSLKFDGAIQLPAFGSERVCKLRICADFPETEGEEVATGRIYFTLRRITGPAHPGVFPRVWSAGVIG